MMNGAEYIVDQLVRQGVRDVFGIPGGVILELLYAFHARRQEIAPHLCAHEQAAGFAANGYAQASGGLGLAYATRGPGFTNLITAMADAYCDSIPVLYLSAHAAGLPVGAMRVTADQEIDSCGMVRNITKYAARVDSSADLPRELGKACFLALEGRPGPVFLDISTRVLEASCPAVPLEAEPAGEPAGKPEAALRETDAALSGARRPVLLLGDGINQARMQKETIRLIEKLKIPVLSSRYAHNLAGASPYYFGYVGSHGTRAANFILSKTDLVISLGNRLHFPTGSASFRSVPEQARILRFDIDPEEFRRDIPNALNFRCDIRNLLPAMLEHPFPARQDDGWVRCCREIRDRLEGFDDTEAVRTLRTRLERLPSGSLVVCDVGNNEFRVSQACVAARSEHRVLYSKSFGALGCALGKAVGAWYASRKPVLCIAGDQGLQFNIQELQTLVQNGCEVHVLVLDDRCSGMIRDRERDRYQGRYVHTTRASGYGAPDFEKVFQAYGLDRTAYSIVPLDETEGLSPSLPKGNPIQKMVPELEQGLYNYLDQL